MKQSIAAALFSLVGFLFFHGPVLAMAMPGREGRGTTGDEHLARPARELDLDGLAVMFGSRPFLTERDGRGA
ncbi:unnamed protein product, partial [Amoebophrya sp. A25]|eukprot:GSA25T00009799001.1